MNPTRIGALLLLAALALTMPAEAAELPALSARSAFLMDADTGRVLYEQDADTPMLIASTTKIMTALVVIEHCDLEQKVDIKQEWTGIEGSSVYLTAGETLTVQELLYCMLLRSGNDAAMALACCCAGSEEAFAVLMNEKAAALGLTHSSFTNPHGLDGEEHFSSARDLAQITAAAMEHESFCEIVATESITIGQRHLTNHNKMLKFYDGATGVKTGYTRAAGRTLVSAAERDGMRLIAVTLNAPNDWTDHTALLDHGFDNYRRQQLCGAGESVAQLPVIGGEEESVEVRTAAACELTLKEGESVTTAICLPRFVYAAVEAERRLGTLKCYVNGEVYEEVPLVGGAAVAQPAPDRGGLLRWLRDLF